MKRIGIPAVVLATVFAVGCQGDNARETAADSPAKPVGTAGDANSDISRGDRDFVEKVAIANMAEIELGRMAVARAATPDVKKFGQMMIDDHTAAGEKFRSAVTPHNITLPTALDDDHRDLQDKLSSRQAAEFDRDYIAAMVDGHEDLLDTLGSRVDQAKLGEWRTRYDNELARKKTEEHQEATAITPEPSDNPVTASLNKIAADLYPTVYAHLQSAKALDDKLKNRTTP
jgi:putative membrane protein